jgi:hypothetical protein
MTAHSPRQFELLPPEPRPSPDGACHVAAVGLRRDGRMRYWCLAHRADATGKYGRKLSVCRGAAIAPISEAETLTLALDQFAGGVALWGAVPPVYDTTCLPLDGGVHVHAREFPEGAKVHDSTFRAVKLIGGKVPKDGITISELDAVYYMVSTVFGFGVRYIECSLCGYPHLDKDWFSIHPHRRHLCAGCGRHFRDTVTGIGNPIAHLQAATGLATREPVPAELSLDIRQSDYTGGIQIWGSNPAIIWSAAKAEEAGIHVHAFKGESDRPDIDNTFSTVAIDGVTLDPAMVRTLMAQNTLPHIVGRVFPMRCVDCNRPAFDEDEEAFTPEVGRRCSKCGGDLGGSGRLRKAIANPLIEVLERLSSKAPRLPQRQSLGFLPETL